MNRHGISFQNNTFHQVPLCEMVLLLPTADIHWGCSSTLDTSQFYLYGAFHNILFQSSLYLKNCSLKPQLIGQRPLWQEQKSIKCLRGENVLERNQTLLEKANLLWQSTYYNKYTYGKYHLVTYNVSFENAFMCSFK